MTDEQVLARVMAGRRQEYGVLVERYLPVVRAVAYANLGHHPDADDAVQDAFVQAYQSLDTLREPAKFGPWLAAIARNCCRAALRKQRESRLSPAQEAVLPAANEDPARKELRELLQARIHALDPLYRETLLLYYYGGVSASDIAGLQAISEDAVRKRLQRGREMLSQDMIADLRDLLEPAESAEDARRRIMRGIAAAPPAWEAGGLAAAAYAVVSLGGLVSVKTGGVVMAAALAVCVVGFGVMQDAPEPPPPAPDQAAVPTDEEAVDAASSTAPSRQASFTEQAEESEPDAVEDESVGAVIEGVVVDQDGEGMPRMGVAAVDGERGYQDLHPASPTDEDGWFRIEGLEPGRYDLYVARDPRSEPTPFEQAPVIGDAQRLSEVWITEPEQEITRRRLVFEKEIHDGIIAGRVIDTAGEPIPDVRVSAAPERSGPGSRTRTDDDGRFEATGLGDMSYRIFASHNDYAGAGTENVPAGAQDVELVLSQYGAITGRVLDAATGMSITEFELDVRLYRPERPVPEIDPLELATFDGRQISDPEGRYEREKIISGRPIGILARAEGYVPAYIDLPPVSEGETVSNADIHLEPGGNVIDGVVANRAGKPLPDASVYWRTAYVGTDSDGVHESDLAATTGEDGTFRIEGLPAGRYEFITTHSDYLPQHTEVNVETRRHTRVNIVMDNTGGEVTGTVTRDGEPVANAEVSVRCAEIPFARPVRSATTNDDGEYLVEQAPVGPVSVSVDGGGRHEATVRKGLETVVDFHLSKNTANIVGRVTIDGTVTRDGHVSISIPASGDRPAVYRYQELIDGGFRITDLPGGVSAEVSVSARPDPDVNELIRATEIVQLRDGRTTERNFELERGARLSGTINVGNNREHVTAVLVPEDTSIRPFNVADSREFVEEDVERLREREGVIRASSHRSRWETDDAEEPVHLISYSFLGVAPGSYTLLVYQIDLSELPGGRPIKAYDTYPIVIEEGETEYELDIDVP